MNAMQAYELDAAGEATGDVLFFCSPQCSAAHAAENQGLSLSAPVAGDDSQNDGMQCCQCGAEACR